MNDEYLIMQPLQVSKLFNKAYKHHPKISSTYLESEKCQFYCRHMKIYNFQKGLAPLFLVQSCSTIAQINRLDM